MKKYSLFSRHLLLSSLSLSLFSTIIYGDEIRDLTSQSEASLASAANEASRLIDTLRNNASQESSTSGRVFDSLDNRFGNGSESSSNQRPAKSNIKSLPSASPRKYPKQESLKDIPLAHEGKEKCKKGSPQSSGKCPSSLLQGLEAKQTINSSSRVQLLIFVSQSVPPDSIEELWAQANRVGGKLLFRGLVEGSFKETQSYIQELGIVADIDPTKFEEFEVAQAPSFVLSKEGKYDKMVGNVSLNAFLEQASTSGDLKEEATELHKNLQRGQS